ncbi:oligosaccharide flippase family protein [Mucilaginibacter sp. AW1-3]
MAKNKLLVRVLSSGMQALAVQVLGSLFFYLISVYISKNDFGIISWMNAVCLLLTTFLGFGLEQVVVRRVAASTRSDWAGMAFFVHSITGFAVTLLLLLLLRNVAGMAHYLPWFFAAQGLVYIAVPLKQFLNAKEKFTPYGVIALASNLCKIAAVCVLLQAGWLDINSVIIILIVSAMFELVCLFVYVISKTTFNFKFRFKAYTKLLKEASAQYISVIFDISLSRMDWILLGLLTTNVVLADYSFAYRAFELARLPMLVIGPLILPRLARLMGTNDRLVEESREQINSFATVEMFFAVMIPLMLNILWVPVVGLITHGKYGDTNALQFLLLSVCMPLQLLINLLWSVSFSAKKYKQVSTITIVCAVLNIVLNLVLIPQLSGLGAAAAFLLTTVLQGILYYSLVRKTMMSISIKPILWCIVSAAVIYFLVSRLPLNCVFQLLIAISAYVAVGIISRQISKQHLVNFKQFLTQ